jgi:hypothetical protein
MALPGLAVLIIAGLSLACGGGDNGGGSPTASASPSASASAKASATAGANASSTSSSDTQGLEDTARQLIQAGAAEVDFFVAHITDSVLQNIFGTTREACRADAQGCVGQGASAVSFSNTTVSGDTGETDVNADGSEFHLAFIKQDGEWLMDELSGITKDIPSGVKTIDLEMKEFEFDFDKSQITDGNFAFKVHNGGDQVHEVIVASIPDDLDLAAAVQSNTQPEGVTQVALGGPVSPGKDTTVVFDKPLDPGRYALLDFIPDRDDANHVPHAKKGMYTDFTVP